MSKKKWHPRAKCPVCGWTIRLPFSDIVSIFGHFDKCPNCGTSVSSSGYTYASAWPVMLMRWISTAKWYNPLTWASGYWETY